MPQMAPMWWFSLQIMFSISFIVMMMLLYFNMNKTNKIKKYVYINKVKWMW